MTDEANMTYAQRVLLRKSKPPGYEEPAPDGVIHYGMGLHGSICGDTRARQETTEKHKVTCPKCKSTMKRTGRL